MQTGSILDRIIASKEDQAKQNFDPAEVIAIILKKLTTKEADVLQRRFGLNGVAQETLEAIGNSYHVTRERVRQIENLAIKKLQHDPNFSNLMKPIEHVVMTVLGEHGGMMSEAQLLEELFLGVRSASNDQAILFILSELVDYRFDQIGPDEEFLKAWKNKTTDIAAIETIITQLINIIAAANQPLSFVDIYNKINDHTISRSAVESYLRISNQLARNPFDEFGLQQWGSVIPRRMNDKIYLVLKKFGKPMHFVDIAQKITEVFKKEAYPPTVHNELILNKQYVLVGRGIYALHEWGYQRGVVADVVAEILKASPQPLTRDDIVAAVLEQRLVKRNTIHLALTNKQRFVRLTDGRYTLA
ncbi:MAG: hypothetical protein HYV33_03865 [Candidatus Kerfeldbacteria bacterium]|nr:hypothetical protein [Candidatus Kerfeldbacteria bacterium]